MCKWVDQAGFCDAYRRPRSVPENIDKIAEFYNAHILGIKERRREMRMGAPRRGEEPSRSPHSEASPYFHLGSFSDYHAEIEDHYNVAMYVVSEAFPLIMGMVIRPSYSRVLGYGDSPAKLDHDYMTPDGRLRHVKLRQNWDWMDYGGENIRAVHLNGSHYDWQFLGAVPPTPYDNAGCTSQTSGGYPDAEKFSCLKNRISQTGQQTGGTVTVLTGPGQGQDQVNGMITDSSQPIYQKTTTRPTFSEPGNKYVDWMYNQDMQVPSHWESSDANRGNQNANWREPLTRKNGTEAQNRPGGFTIYGAARRTLPLDECPVPVEFPWDRVFAKRETFLTPLKTFVKQIPEWADRNIPENPSLEVPKHIRDGLYLMYSKRKNNLPQDANNVAKAWTDSLKTMYELKDSWDIMRSGKPRPAASKPRGSGRKESWWSNNLQGVPAGRNPSFLHNMILGQGVPETTDLCINKLFTPYECCTDTASAYECCFGLLGCIPPPPMLNITKVANLDQITNAQCNGTSNVIQSILFLPRMIFGTWLWTLIFISPTWLRTLEFRVLYPLVYDYGGLGTTENFLGDLFCFIVNLYYPILVTLICFGLYILDAVFLQMAREVIMKADTAVASVQAAEAREYAEIQINGLKEQMAVLEQQLRNVGSNK